MNIKAKLSLIFASLLVCQLPVYAQAFFDKLSPEEQLAKIGLSRFNHYGALSTITDNGHANSFLFYNSVRPEELLNAVLIRNNNEELPLKPLRGNVPEAEAFVTFDPSMKHLFVVGGTRNFVNQFDYDPAEGSAGGFVPSNQYSAGSGFQTPCDDDLTTPDPYRSMQFVAARDTFNNVIVPVNYNMVYITCKSTRQGPSGSYNNSFLVIGYGLKYLPNSNGTMTATLTNLPGGPTITAPFLNNNAATLGKVVGNFPQNNIFSPDVSAFNPPVFAFGPSGKYLYAIAVDTVEPTLPSYVIQQYTFSSEGELTSTLPFRARPPLTPVSMTFSPVNINSTPSGKNLYVVSQNTGAAGGASVSVYNVANQSDGGLQPVDTISIPSDGGLVPKASQIVFNPAATYAYVLDDTNNVIYQYIVNPSNGDLTQQPLKPVFRPSFIVQSLIFDPAGTAFAVEFSKALNDFTLQRIRVNANGTLEEGPEFGNSDVGALSVNTNAEIINRNILHSVVRPAVRTEQLPVNRGSFQSIMRPAGRTNALPARRGSFLSFPF